MSIADRWLLPDGVEDVLPPQARQLEHIRRKLLDLYHTWGYEYVIPPMIEFLESLLTGTGKDLDLRTFKVVDLITGRTMGLRADITPQVARIDAHSLNRDGVVRLCYAGTVIQAQADGMLASRTPLSVGAELFGAASADADLEIVSLMIESLRSLGLQGIHVDLGDVAIFRQLMAELDIDDLHQESLFDCVQRKAAGELRRKAAAIGLDEVTVELICALPTLCGDQNAIDEGRKLFARFPGILECVDNLERIATALTARFPELNIYFDLSELRGYAYHTGIVFAAYVDGHRRVVAKGGRYDHIGQVFGRPERGATGFSISVRNLLAVDYTAGLSAADGKRICVGDIAPDMLQACWVEQQRLRAEGFIVVDTKESAAFDFQLAGKNGQWQLIPL